MEQLKTRSGAESKSGMLDARATRRYPLRELVTFAPNREDPFSSPAAGVTENVSSTGIMFLTETMIEVGSSIFLTLYVPSRNAARTILLHAEGTVLRVEQAGKTNTVAAAVRFDDYLQEGFAVAQSIQ